jgi:hypothetical protein
VVGSRRNWFTIISFMCLFNRPRWLFMSFYQRASVLWFAKYWQPVVVYTRQERCCSVHYRSAVSCRRQAEIQVVVFTFFLFESDVFYCTGKRELAIVCEGVCSGSLATGVQCFLVCVCLFSVLTAWLILLLRLEFWIHISQSCCLVIFTLHLLISPPLFCLNFWFYCFHSLFFVALFFRYFVFIFWLLLAVVYFLVFPPVINILCTQLFTIYVANSCIIPTTLRQMDEICTLLSDYGT